MRQGSAVARRTANSAVADEDPYLADLQGFVWGKAGSRTWKDLADQTGLSMSTVRNFAVGETKRPHERTIRKLMLAFGYRNAWVPVTMPVIACEVGLRR